MITNMLKGMTLLALIIMGGSAQAQIGVGSINQRRNLCFALRPQSVTRDQITELSEAFEHEKSDVFENRLTPLKLLSANLSDDCTIVYDPVVVMQIDGDIVNDLVSKLSEQGTCSFKDLPASLQNAALGCLSRGRGPKEGVLAPSEDAKIGFEPTVMFELEAEGKSIPCYFAQEMSKEASSEVYDKPRVHPVSAMTADKWSAYGNEFYPVANLANYIYSVLPIRLPDITQMANRFIADKIKENSERNAQMLKSAMDKLLKADYQIDNANSVDDLSKVLQDRLKERMDNNWKQLGFKSAEEKDRWLSNARIKRKGAGLLASIATGKKPSEGITGVGFEAIPASPVR